MVTEALPWGLRREQDSAQNLTLDIRPPELWEEKPRSVVVSGSTPGRPMQETKTETREGRGLHGTPHPRFPRRKGLVSPWKRTGLRAWQTLSGCSDPSEHPHVHARWTHRPWVTRLLSQWRPCSAADGGQTRAQVAHLFRASGGGSRACCTYLLFKV